MHFHCTQCRHQFCSGCYNAFYAKNVSSESELEKERCGRRPWGLRGGVRERREVSRIESIPVLFPPLLAPDSPLTPTPLHRGS